MDIETPNSWVRNFARIYLLVKHLLGWRVTFHDFGTLYAAIDFDPDSNRWYVESQYYFHRTYWENDKEIIWPYSEILALIYWDGPLLTCFKTHLGWVTHICVSKQNSIGSDNGLSPDRCQAIIWTNAGILLIGPLGITLIEINFD